MIIPQYIEAFDIPDAHFKTIQAALKYGYERPVFRGARKEQRRKELDWLMLRIKCPKTRPLVINTPTGVPPPTDMKYINNYLAYIASPFKSDESYTYGERSHGTYYLENGGSDTEFHRHMHHIDAKEGQRASALDFNQFETITKFLKETPETNRAIVEIGKAEDLLMDDPPCLRVYQFKIRYGCLYMLLYFRSWDIWGGFPSNLAAYQMLKESLLNELNEHYEKVNHPIIKNGLITDGEMLATSVGAHIYSGEWKYARMLVDRAYYNQVMTEGSVFVPKE